MEESYFRTKAAVRLLNQSAATFSLSSAIVDEIANRLIERLGFIKIQPNIILDLDFGVGMTSIQLSKIFKKAKVIHYNPAWLRAKMAKKKKKFFAKQHFCVGLPWQLPFPDHSLDFIFSNLLFMLCPDINLLFHELVRVLKPEGLLLFTTAGPDTLKELKQIWQNIDEYGHVTDFVDMHDIGDALLHAKFSDPVMDMELLKIKYPSLSRLVNDLKGLGALNLHRKQFKGLCSKNKWVVANQAFETLKINDEVSMSCEVVYGHAWAPTLTATLTANESGEVIIPISHLKTKK